MEFAPERRGVKAGEKLTVPAGPPTTFGMPTYVLHVYQWTRSQYGRVSGHGRIVVAAIAVYTMSGWQTRGGRSQPMPETAYP
jgi:hypothetical protein